MGNVIPLTPYVFHTERIERYKKDIEKIELAGGRNCDPDARKKQAIHNLCWEEYFDATVHLTGRRISFTPEGHVLCTEYYVLRIVMLNEIQSEDRSCFGIVYKDYAGKEATLRVTPSTKISVYPE